MKTILVTFFSTALVLAAQSPPALPPMPPSPGARVAPRPTVNTSATGRVANPFPAAPPSPAATAAPRPTVSASATGQVANPFPAAPPAPAATRPGPANPALPRPGSTPAQTNEMQAISPRFGVGAMAGTLEDMPTNTFNFPSIDINQFLTFYAELIGRTILRPAALPAPAITLKTQAPLTRKEALQAFDTLLAMNGITIIKVGDKFAKAVPSASAFQEGAPFSKMDPNALPETGQYDVHLVQLRYTKPSELLPVLTPFAKIPNSVLAIDSSQILVIRDYAENVRRMLEMIKQIDINVPAEFISEVIQIKYALASEISSALNSLSGGGGGGTSVGRSSTGARTTTGRPTTPGYPGAGGVGGMGGMGGVGGMGGIGGMGVSNPMGTPGVAGGTTAAGGSSFTDRLRSIMQKATASGDLQIIGQTKIIADERTNSLLIFATRQDMEMIKEIVSKLDVVLAQVLIETIIMDVSLSDSYDLGVSYLLRPKTTGDYTGAGALNNTGFLTPGNFSSVTTNGTDALRRGFNYFGRFGQDLDFTVKAFADDSAVKVIQKPRIMTSHATPASVFIGETVPYVTSTYYGGGYGGGPSSSYQQLRVGIQLSVTPFINQDGLVVMKIDESIDELGTPVPITGVGDVPSTVSRTFSAEVAVKDRETIVLGGFIKSNGSDSKNGVPILKDLPLLGKLFSSTSKSKDRKELVVLMRPTVLRTPDLAAAQTAKEKRRLPGISTAEAEDELAEAEQVKRSDETLKRLSPELDRARAGGQTEAEQPQSKEVERAEPEQESNAAAAAARKAEAQQPGSEETRAEEPEPAQKKAEAEAMKQSRTAAAAALKAEEQRLAAEKMRAKAEVEQAQKKAKPDWELFNQVQPVTPEQRKALEAGGAPPPYP